MKFPLCVLSINYEKETVTLGSPGQLSTITTSFTTPERPWIAVGNYISNGAELVGELKYSEWNKKIKEELIKAFQED